MPGSILSYSINNKFEKIIVKQNLAMLYYILFLNTNNFTKQFYVKKRLAAFKHQTKEQFYCKCVGHWVLTCNVQLREF